MGARGVMAITYTTNISDFVDDKNLQILTNFTSKIFNTQVKALMHDGYIFTLINVMLASLLRHNKHLKDVSG